MCRENRTVYVIFQVINMKYSQFILSIMIRFEDKYKSSLSFNAKYENFQVVNGWNTQRNDIEIYIDDSSSFELKTSWLQDYTV